MASFPTSVKSFATHVANDVIASAHVNDLQDEVVAIEDGYRNATAPLNSSGSTLATLTVSGASALAGLTVSGASSLAGTLAVAGNSSLTRLFTTISPPYARLTNSSATNIETATVTAINFTVERDLSTSTMHSTGTNPSRLKPASSGVYQIWGSVEWQASTTGNSRQTHIRINGSSIVGSVVAPWVDGPTVVRQYVDTLYRFRSTGDYAELAVYHDATSSLNIQVGADYSPDFAMVKVR